MITRVYFLSAQQENDGGKRYCFRTMVYKSWFAPKAGKIINEFISQISEENNLPSGEWVINSFSKVI